MDKSEERKAKKLFITVIAILLFLAWTIAISKVNLQPVGPENSVVGFASFNTMFHEWSGVHWFTDIIGGVLLATALVMMYETAISVVQNGNPEKDIPV